MQVDISKELFNQLAEMDKLIKNMEFLIIDTKIVEPSIIKYSLVLHLPSLWKKGYVETKMYELIIKPYDNHIKLDFSRGNDPYIDTRFQEVLYDEEGTVEDFIKWLKVKSMETKLIRGE
jgi:hypothetical protein